MTSTNPSPKRTRLLAHLPPLLLALLVIGPLLGLRGAHAASPNSITTLSFGIAYSNSLVLDANGYPVVSSFYTSDGDPLLLHCNDANCDGGGESVSSPDARGSSILGLYSSLALDVNGYPVVSYYSASGEQLVLLHCNDANCTGGSESISSPDPALSVGEYTSLVLDASGYPVVSYHDSTNDDLKLLHCNDANCTGGDESVASPDTALSVGEYTSLVLDASGYPVVSYHDSTNGDLKLLHCNDANCTGSDESITSPDTEGYVGQYTSLVLDASGYPVVSYIGESTLKLLHCGSSLCKVDTTQPMITAQVVGTLGNNGWYVSNVTVSWNVADAESVISAQSGCDPTVLTSDTPSITLTCTATSEGGSSSLPVTLKLDKSAPTLAPVVSPNLVGLGGVATVNSGAADSLSGLASQNCGTLDTSSVGSKSVTCTAVDNAGNTASATVNYMVAYPWTGFMQPVDNYPTVNTVNAGQGVPVKFSLGGNFGLAIFANGYPKVQTFACGSSGSGGSDPIEETVTAGNSSLQYDAATQTYTYIWKTDKAWAGTCRQLIVRLTDGVDHIALFQFNGKARSADANQDEAGAQQLFLPLVNR